jgi:sigma-B regulation protein RsbU (phosphoserine phosphatase)
MQKNFLKKVLQFSIRTKILFLGTGIILVGFSVYVPYVKKSFINDKSSYIQNDSLNEAHDVQVSVSNILESREKDLAQLSIYPKEFFDGSNYKTFAKKTNLLQYERYNFDGNFQKTISVNYELSLRNHSLEKYNLKEITNPPVDLFPAASKKIRHQELLHLGKIPLLRLFFYDEEHKTLHYAQFVIDEITDRFSNNTIYSNAMVNMNGTSFEAAANFGISKEIVEALPKLTSEGSISPLISGVKHFLGYSRVPKSDWIILSLIPESTAYKEANDLVNRSISFAGIIISISVIFGTLLAQNLTAPIDDLVEGTEQISKGNFHHVIRQRNDDELGRLASSFNYMNKELLRYIEEVKEKSRMENELAVAQLVQSSFFPEKAVVSEHFSVFGHYSSASECGGDWWGTRTIGKKNLLFIADATGHGVPAALITATANCVANLLPQICEFNPELLESPAKILDYFNSAVYRVGGKILMTFFIGIYDQETKVLKYANASHNPPYLYRYSENEPQKSDITLLLDAEGERLGHIENPKYTESSVILNTNDVLIMVTDGIIEAENPEHKQYGERRFIKSILKHAKSSPEQMMAGILSDATEYLEGVKPEDDVTLIVAKRETA